MHDHGSPATRFNVNSTPEQIRNSDFDRIMGETKQLHSMHSISHHYHPHLSHPHQSLHQFPLQNQHPHQHDSLLYGYMVSQQQHRPLQQTIDHQIYAQEQNSAHRNQMRPSQPYHHVQLQQQQQQLQHQLPQAQHDQQQHIPKQYEEQYSSNALPNSQHDAVHQRDHYEFEQEKHLCLNSTQQTQYESGDFQNKPSDSQTETLPKGFTEETHLEEREPKSFQDLDDVDEDMLDDEEEENLRVCYEQCRQSLLLKHPNVATELLNFAENASLDIQRFFGRTKGEEDACDVYEDKWAATKSGRELYYADLIRIAQGGDTEPASSKKGKKPGFLASHRTSPSTTSFSCTASSASSSSSSVSPPSSDILDTRGRYSGKRDVTIGMGALSDLFEIGLSDQPGRNSCNGSSRTRHTTAQRSRNCVNRAAPKMRERSFPNSFWKEPSSRISAGYVCVTAGTNLDYSHIAPMSNSKLPDFSDLMESWHGGVEALVNPGHDRDPAMDSSLQHQH